MKSLKASQLPQYLNMYQAKAWVLYRDYSIIDRSTDWWAFEDSEREKLGTEMQLKQKLLSGDLVAWGKRKESITFEKINPIDWEDMEIAPLDDRWPYVLKRVNGRELEKIFPVTGGMVLPTANFSTVQATRRGRTPGTGSNDDKYIQKMKELIVAGTYNNASAAASAIVLKLYPQDFKNQDADIKRLSKKYRRKQMSKMDSGTLSNNSH